MGNNGGKDGFCPEGSHLDLFQTPPTSPSAPDLIGTPTASISPPPEAQPDDVTTGAVSTSIAPEQAAECFLAGWPSSLIAWSLDRGDPEQGGPDGAGRGEARPGEGSETVLGGAWALLRLLEQHKGTLGLSRGQDVAAGAVGLLRSLLEEREQLAEEVQHLKETLKSEREEWLQFQADLQVAVSVAERLRLEAEEALSALRLAHGATQAQLEAAQSRQQQTDRELESSRVELAEASHRLSTLTPEHRRGTAEPDSPQRVARAQPGRERVDSGGVTDRGDEGTGGSDGLGETGGPVGLGADPDDGVESMKGNEAPKNDEMDCGGGGMEVEKRRCESYSGRDPRRIVLLTERSRSLSRIPLPSDPPSGTNGNSQSLTGATGPHCWSRDPAQARRPDRLLQRQDSWSSFYTSKQEEEHSLDGSAATGCKLRPQDGFSVLLRRHGGSRRNSLLRWCQGRTQGYKNIEITNFSTSWEDGLAFCAVYHTFLPTHIPFSNLKPENRRENLNLAFRTGESVGIAATLTLEEMLRSEGPDWQRVLGYVESMYRHFEM